MKRPFILPTMQISRQGPDGLLQWKEEPEVLKSQGEKSITVSGILSVVFGGIALLTSFIPIINNGSAVMGFVGAILGIVAVFATRSNGKKSGRALAIVGLVISVISIVIVLALQSTWAAALS